MSETPNIEALEAIAEEQARRAASLPVHEQIIIKSTIRHLINGAYWGFDTDIETRLSRVSEDLQKAGSKDAIVWNLRRGGIVEVKSFETAVTIMRKAVGIEGFSNEMCEKAMKAHRAGPPGAARVLPRWQVRDGRILQHEQV